MVEKDILQKAIFKEMYKYTQTLSSHLKSINKDATYNNPILWQVASQL